jgi:hypothetical protein
MECIGGHGLVQALFVQPTQPRLLGKLSHFEEWANSDTSQRALPSLSRATFCLEERQGQWAVPRSTPKASGTPSLRRGGRATTDKVSLPGGVLRLMPSTSTRSACLSSSGLQWADWGGLRLPGGPTGYYTIGDYA